MNEKEKIRDSYRDHFYPYKNFFLSFLSFLYLILYDLYLLCNET